MRLTSPEHCFPAWKFPMTQVSNSMTVSPGSCRLKSEVETCWCKILIRSPFVEPRSLSMHSHTERRRFPWHVHLMAGSAAFKESCTQKRAARSPWWSVHVVISCGAHIFSTRFHAFFSNQNLLLHNTTDDSSLPSFCSVQGQIHMAVVCQKGQKSAADPTPNQAGSFLVWYSQCHETAAALFEDNYFAHHVCSLEVGRWAALLPSTHERVARGWTLLRVRHLDSWTQTHLDEFHMLSRVVCF